MRHERAILHVDDDPVVTQIVAAQLAKHGYVVTGQNDPHKTIDSLRQGGQRVVMLDIDMPDYNGIELLTDIKQYDSGIQAVMLTGLVSSSMVLQSMRRGAEGCIFKPLNDIQPLLTVLEATFTKLDRWWNTLEELVHAKKTQTQTAARD